MAKVTYRQIEAFRAVMQGGTTTRAADILCISQPAVSRLLHDFEQTVGVSMFERHRRRLVPTAEARFFYEEVERAFVSLEQLSRAAEELREFHLGSLRIAGMPAISLDFLPGVVRGFLAAHSGVSATLQVRNTQQVIDLVAGQHFDLGVISAIPVDDPAVVERALLDSRVVCVLPAGHPLADREHLEPEDLAGETFVSLGPEQRLRESVDRLFEEREVKRHQAFDTQLHYAACGFVLAGGGVSLVDPMTALHYRKLGLVVKRFEPRIPYRYSLIVPRDREPSRLARAFIDRVREEARLLARETDDLFSLTERP